MRRTVLGLIGVVLTTSLLGGCSDDGGSPPGPTATATKAATIAATSTATRLATIPATSTATIPGTIPATSTSTPTGSGATPTPSGGGAVSGLVVVRSDYRAGAGDALNAPPEEW